MAVVAIVCTIAAHTARPTQPPPHQCHQPAKEVYFHFLLNAFL
jgi:hypothetical protein